MSNLHDSSAQNTETILSNYDSLAIEGLFHKIAQDIVSGLSKGKAKKLFLDLPDILKDDNAEDILHQRTRELSHDQKALYAKFLTISNTLKPAAFIIAVQNAAKEPEQNEYDIDHMIRLAKEKGITGKQLGNIIGTIAQWKTGTAHPTQHLSEEGIKLQRALFALNETEPQNRAEQANKIIRKMFDTDITRSAKMQVREETMSDREQAKLRRTGLRQTYRELNASLKKHYEDEAPDLLDRMVKLELSYHTWSGGGDSDGKPNADKFALLEGMVGYTKDALEEHLMDIKKVIDLDPSATEMLQKAETALEKALTRATSLEQQLLNANNQTDFNAMKQAYANLYSNLEIHNGNDDPSIKTEKDMYLKLAYKMRDVCHHLSNEEAKNILEESLFVLRQHKDTITTAKIEVRANGIIDQQIMNTLFGDEDFQKAFLDGTSKRLLANRAFTSLSHNKQRTIINKAHESFKDDPDAFKDNYYRIFSEDLDDKGFPNQLRERGERLAVQAITPDKFGMAIVADAQDMSPEYQRFLGELGFGISNMMHTMLTEDFESLNNAATITTDFTKHRRLHHKFNSETNAQEPRGRIARYGSMLPCSDSTKKLGPVSAFLQSQAINHLARFAVKENVAMCIKWGNGQILTRGGGNAHIPGRLKAQALQWHLNGRPLNLNNDGDIKLLANVTFASNTEQGRAADFMSFSPSAVARNQLNTIGEMLGRSLELTGHVEKGTYIKQVPNYSKGIRTSVFESIAKDIMMLGYQNFRDAVDEKGKRISDSVASKVSNMKVAGDANQGARPDSKEKATAQKSEKPLYDLRAIGTTIAINHMRTYHDGWFKLYYDQALFVTYTEKLAELHLKESPMPDTLKEIEEMSVDYLDNNENRIGRFQLGEHTRTLYPYVNQDNNGNRRQALPSQILCDVAEESHNEFSQEERYAITAAQRSTSTWNILEILSDLDSYNSKPYPIFKKNHDNNPQSFEHHPPEPQIAI